VALSQIKLFCLLLFIRVTEEQLAADPTSTSDRFHCVRWD